MPRPRRDDFFASLRLQAQKVLAALTREIQQRERELQNLISQAKNWRVIIGGAPRTQRSASRTRGRAAASRPAAAVRSRSTRRVNWDEVLASVPQRFGVGEIL